MNTKSLHPYSFTYNRFEKPLVWFATWAITGVLYAGGDAASQAEIESLKSEISALDQKIRVIERQREIEADASASRAATQPKVTAGEKGFQLESADRSWILRARANVQLDGRAYLDDETANNDRFLLRRVRPSLEGTVYEDFTFRVMPDFAPSNVELLEAWGNYRAADEFNVLFGRTKSPVGLERLVSQTNLIFIERGHPTSLLPNRDTGIQLHGKAFEDRIEWNTSLLNGTLDGGSSAVAPADDNFEFAGRLFVKPLANEPDSLWKNTGVGVAGTYGVQEDTPRGYSTTGQTSVFTWNSNTRIDGEVTRLSPQAYAYIGSFGLLAEAAWSTQRLTRLSSSVPATDITNFGWQVYGSWVITGEDASYNGVKPENPLSFSKGSWGAWELALRYGELDVDDDAFPNFASASTSVDTIRHATAGINWYWNRNFKIQFNYDTSWFDGGKASGKDRDTEHALLSRIQLNF